MRKINYPIIGLIAALLYIPGVFAQQAQGVPFSGTAYNEEIGVLHMQAYTAKKTGDPVVDDDAAYYHGLKNQFYISPLDQAYIDLIGIDRVAPDDADLNAVMNVSTEAANCMNDKCFLKGFIWNDEIGWIVLNGALIDKEIRDSEIAALVQGGMSQEDAENQINAEEETVDDPYTISMYPAVDTEGAFSGFAWNEFGGWIILSDPNGITPPLAESAMDEDNFGVWLDVDAPFDDDFGRTLRGYAWSETFGWIKFYKEAGDTFDFDFGTFTKWVPDNTPPIILSNDPVWFQVGTAQAGYDGTNDPVNIQYRFAQDEESLVDENSKRILLSPSTETPSCNAGGSHTMEKAGDPALGGVDIFLAGIGIIHVDASSDPGYCKYILHAAVPNNVNLITYVGDHFVDIDQADIDAGTSSMTQEQLDAAPKQDPITIFVRAGDHDPDQSLIVQGSNAPQDGEALADGEDFVSYEIQLKDMVGNSIVDFDCEDYPFCPSRTVAISSDFANTHIFDFTDPIDPPLCFDELFQPIACLTPLLFDDIAVGTTGDPVFADETARIITRPASDTSYRLQVASYAPSESYIPITNTKKTKDFQLDTYDFEIVNDELGATNRIVTSNDPLTLVDDNNTVLSGYTANGSVKDGDFTPLAIAFQPPVTTGGATVFTGEPGTGLEDVLSLGAAANINFNLTNISDVKPVTNLDIDTHFQFYSGDDTNPVLALLETYHIRNNSEFDTDTDAAAWSDPFAVTNQYELVGIGSKQSNDDAIDISTSLFRDAYPFVFDLTDIDNLENNVRHNNANMSDQYILDYSLPPKNAEFNRTTADGEYFLKGSLGIPVAFDESDDNGELPPFNLPPSIIDRVDEAELKLGQLGSTDPTLPDTRTKRIDFTPQKFVSETISDIQFRVVQDIAYRYDDAPLFTFYSNPAPLREDLSVKDLAIQATGTVAGEQIVTGRDFDIVGTTGVANLQEQIRFNVAQLTIDINKEACTIAEGTVVDIAEFSTTPGPCVVFDGVNKTYIAYYNGTENESVRLYNNGDGLVPPNAPYTLIIEGGANLIIADNVHYDNVVDPTNNPLASLGIIVRAETIGQGANVLLRPEPTNMIGVLYAEGSLLSQNESGQFYYGGSAAPQTDLKNQLYWHGSIASRNTIGGAGQKKRPEGTTCTGATTLECAQRFDLDFLRRFSTTSTQVANDGMFSGGGTCDGVTCSLPDPQVMASKIAIDSGSIDLDASEDAPFFIERDPLRADNPPPGFTISGTQETIQQIR